MSAEKSIIEKLDEVKEEIKRNTDEQIKALTVREKPEEFVSYEADRKTITGTGKDLVLTETPQFVFENPRKVDVLVKSITMVGDDVFLQKTKIRIMIEGLAVYQTKSAGVLTDSSGVHLSFQRGIVLPAQKSVNIFVSNSVDATEFKCAVEIGISER